MRFRQILHFASHVLFEHSEILCQLRFPVMNNNGLGIHFPEILTDFIFRITRIVFGNFLRHFSWNIRLEQVFILH